MSIGRIIIPAQRTLPLFSTVNLSSGLSDALTCPYFLVVQSRHLMDRVEDESIRL